jgi:hypothetical protein
MGLLDDYSQLLTNERVKERVKGFLDPVSQQLKSNLESSYPFMVKSPLNAKPEDYFGLLGGGVGVAGAIKTWHGSPHKFDAFDMSKIGTGEGAQAYGHGLYFAENPEVAKEYLKVDPPIDAPLRRSLMGTEYEPGTWEYKAASLLSEMPLQKARKLVSGWIDNAGEHDDVAGYKTALDLLNRATKKSDAKVLKPEKQLYQTSLEWPDAAREAADPLGPQHFLDWDKPLADQNQKIKQALAKYDPDTYHPDGYDYDEMESGADIYTRLKSSGLDGKLSDLLGIPGIRYLDQGSRGAGEGSYNYVVFDDKIPKIIERNGKPVGLLGQ